jgi:CheY-like chemotaxis protein
MSGARVLVVEDDDALRETVVELLRFRGFEVFQAANGQEALEALEHDVTEPCLILLDLMMPVMSGWEFISELGRREIHQSSSIYVVTAANDAAIRERFPVLQKPMGVLQVIGLAEGYSGESAHAAKH